MPHHPSRRRLLLVLGAVLLVLGAVNVADKYGPHHTGLIAGPIVALALVLLARRAGLTWHDLGLSRRAGMRVGAHRRAQDRRRNRQGIQRLARRIGASARVRLRQRLRASGRGFDHAGRHTGWV